MRYLPRKNGAFRGLLHTDNRLKKRRNRFLNLRIVEGAYAHRLAFVKDRFEVTQEKECGRKSSL